MLYYVIKEAKYTNGFNSPLKADMCLPPCENSSFLTEALHAILSRGLGKALTYDFMRNSDVVNVYVKTETGKALAVTISYVVDPSGELKRR